MAGLVYFSFSQLFKHGVHLGLQSTLLHSSMLKYLLPLNYLNFALFNLNFAYASLRLISNFIIIMNSMRKPSLVINSVSFLDDFLVDFFSGLNQPIARGLWVSGRLTNFRFVRQSSVRRFYLHKIIIKAFTRIESMGLSNSSIRNVMNRTFNPIRYKQSVFRHVMNLTRMPRFCFINDSTINAVSVNECFILNIPSICSVDSGSSNIFYVTYPIPGNSVSLASVLLYYSIHKYSIQRGIYKERYLFILNSLKAKLKLHMLLKQSLSIQKASNKSQLPFLKVKIHLNYLATSIVSLFNSYKVSSLYNYFFTTNLLNFKKWAKKYLIIIRSFFSYNQYLTNSNNKLLSTFNVSNSKLYNYLLLPSFAACADIRSLLPILSFLQLGDLVVASILRDVFAKTTLDSQAFRFYLPSHSLVSIKCNKQVLKTLLQFIKMLQSFSTFKPSFCNLIYYTIYTSTETSLLFYHIDLFNNNFLFIYKKLFLFQKKIVKLYHLNFKTLFLTLFISNFSTTLATTLLLWVSLFKNCYDGIPSSLLISTSYLPCVVANSAVDCNWFYSKALLEHSYSLFYKSLSLNYRHVKPFILNFSKIQNNVTSFFKVGQSVGFKFSRRW